MRCALHPETETNLRCSKCGQFICPKCLVQTPIGARCPECAALKRLPVYDVSAVFYARAIAAGLITASVLGAIWPFIPLGGFLSLIIAAGIGYAIGEVVSLSVNRKRGLRLQVIAGTSMVVSYTIRSLLEAPHLSFVHSFLNVYVLIALALGIIIAVSRLR
ncbi:MAG: hypothetical protein E3J81_05295 [Dehalococcoidia bacterium]|nr:MAG: hypothetical protein E3J81_05295 [Dehalococcoidia bacterium]